MKPQAVRNRPGTPIKDRLHSTVLIAENGCWEWQAYRHHKGGYGRVWYQDRLQMAHRVSYMVFVGPIPEGMTVDHLCFNGGCINPEHLRLLSHLENSRLQRKGLATHCQRGHEFTPENTWTASGTRRTCKTCAQARYKPVAQRRTA